MTAGHKVGGQAVHMTVSPYESDSDPPNPACQGEVAWRPVGWTAVMKL